MPIAEQRGHERARSPASVSASSRAGSNAALLALLGHECGADLVEASV